MSNVGTEPQPLAASWQTSLSEEEERAHAAMIGALRPFLNAVAAARPDAAVLTALAGELQSWSAGLAQLTVAEGGQVFGRRLASPDRGQTMTPVLTFDEQGQDRVHGTVLFGRYFLGCNGAAHGGAISLLFDEVLGRLANAGAGPMARTAYLHTEFRSVTPIDVELQISAWRVSQDGRKTTVRAELKDGSRVCAEAEALFIALRPGQS